VPSWKSNRWAVARRATLLSVIELKKAFWASACRSTVVFKVFSACSRTLLSNWLVRNALDCWAR
jgi:hypothetical protein